MAIVASMFCCAVRAGRSTTRRCIGGSVEEGLQVRKRKRKRISRGERRPIVVPAASNERWSMDFQHDMLATGQRFRTLNIVDDFPTLTQTPQTPPRA
jgi:hypothetical protein